MLSSFTMVRQSVSWLWWWLHKSIHGDKTASPCPKHTHKWLHIKYDNNWIWYVVRLIVMWLCWFSAFDLVPQLHKMSQLGRTEWKVQLCFDNLLWGYTLDLWTMRGNPQITYSWPSVSKVPLYPRIPQPTTDCVVLLYLLLKSIHIYLDPHCSNLHCSRVSCNYFNKKFSRKSLKK